MKIPYFSESSLHPLFDQLAEGAAASDRSALWPAQQLTALAEAGVLAWEIPPEFGGTSTRPGEMARFFLDCSRGCLTTAFVLSQRNAAVSRIAGSGNESLKQQLLPDLASGKKFTTVGISHLSTSRQYLREPAVTAIPQSGGYLLSGTVPWVTGGSHADWLVTGATITAGTEFDGQQLLSVVAGHDSAIRCGEPASLLALNGSATSNLELDHVFVPFEQIIAGPSPAVMKSGPGGTGSLTTSTLALGVAGRAIAQLLSEMERNPTLCSEVEPLAQEWHTVTGELLAAEQASVCLDPMFSQTVRARANSLVLRASQAYLTIAKGAGFVAGHPAERTLRESMFFLVWSCPQPVAQAALREFGCTPSWL